MKTILVIVLSACCTSFTGNAYTKPGRANINQTCGGTVVDCYTDGTICWTDDNGNSQIPPPAGTKIKVLVNPAAWTWEEWVLASYTVPGDPTAPIVVTGGHPTAPPATIPHP